MAMTPPQRAATILDVAALAGVSKSVVSLVLRGTGYVSAAKRDAVDRAVAELGYRTNAAARALVESRSRTVGVVLNDMRNPWFVPAVEGLNARLNKHGMQMIMGDFRLDSRSGESLLQKLLEMKIEGLVLVGTMPPSPALEAAVALVPTVVLGAPEGPAGAVTIVTNDDGAGARLAVQHLIALGHQRIAHVGAAGTAVGAARRQGYEQAMSDAGLGRFIHTEPGTLTEDGGYRAGLALLKDDDPKGTLLDGTQREEAQLNEPLRPTAIFAVNDMAALGVISAAEECGLSIPAELSVAGYDNTPLAQLRRISLTSVDNSSYAAGERAAELLLARLVPGAAMPANELLPPVLETRGSTGAPLVSTSSTSSTSGIDQRG